MNQAATQTPAPAAAASSHPLDQALALTAQGPDRFLAHTHAGYWNMVGPFGGSTAALALQAVLQHPQRLGDPIALTVNYPGPLQAGPIQVHAVAVRTNRSTQHWTVSLSQEDEAGRAQVATTATVVTAVRRETFSVDEVDPPAMPEPERCERYDISAGIEWLQRYDMRVVKGSIPKVWDDSGQDSVSQLWVRDDPPRPVDFASLAALCDVFFPRVWLRRARRVPAGTVSMTVYFHADLAQLQRQGDQYLLAQACAQSFRNGFSDQTAQLWDREGALLATSHQIVYYKE